MKKIFTLLAATSLLILPSCRFIRVSDELKEKLKEGAVTVVTDKDGETVTASDNLVSEDKETGTFDALLCNLPCDMVYTPGDCALSISGPDNVLKHIAVYNEGSRLTLKSDGANFRNLKSLKIRISTPSLKELTFNGAVDFQAPQGITAEDFSLVVNGAGDLTIDGLKAAKVEMTVNGAGDVDVNGLDSETLTVSINGAGDAVVSGRTGRADLAISGAGDINAEGLRAEQFDAKVRGIGKVRRPKN